MLKRVWYEACRRSGRAKPVQVLSCRPVGKPKPLRVFICRHLGKLVPLRVFICRRLGKAFPHRVFICRRSGKPFPHRVFICRRLGKAFSLRVCLRRRAGKLLLEQSQSLPGDFPGVACVVVLVQCVAAVRPLVFTLAMDSAIICSTVAMSVIMAGFIYSFLILVVPSIYLMIVFLPFTMYTPFWALPLTRRPLRS